MTEAEHYTIYALKTIQSWEDEGAYWIPLLFAEIKAGRARFGWGYDDACDLLDIQERLRTHGKNAFSEGAKVAAEAWERARFLLDVKVGDYFVYVNQPHWGRISIVRVTGAYQFTKSWDDPEERGDFRHCLPCEFIAELNRNDRRIHPYLSRRFKLQGASYRIHAKEAFAELLATLKTGHDGQTARERLLVIFDEHLRRLAAETNRVFPEKKLEALVEDALQELPRVKEVRRGPDKNGADLEMVFDAGLDISGLERTEVCAVQVKSYEGEMEDTRAIADIRKALTSEPGRYTCGLIVSTALTISASFRASLKQLRQDTGKPIGLLIGRDLAGLLVKAGVVDRE